MQGVRHAQTKEVSDAFLLGPFKGNERGGLLPAARFTRLHGYYRTVCSHTYE